MMPDVLPVAKGLHIPQATVTVVVIELRLVAVPALVLFHEESTSEADQLPATVALNRGGAIRGAAVSAYGLRFGLEPSHKSGEGWLLRDVQCRVIQFASANQQSDGSQTILNVN